MAAVRPANLRCEYLEDPLGIDVSEPRLSWILEPVDPQARGLEQTAYCICVGSRLEDVLDNKGDLWSSGKVKSAETTHIAYAGEPLQSGMDCWWKVRVWDGDSRPSEWSRPAHWSMGLLEPADWSAQWIGYDQRPKDAGMTKGELPPVPFLRKSFNVRKEIRKATVHASALGLYELRINGHRIGHDYFTPGWSDYRKRVYYNTYDVTDTLAKGKNALGIALGDGWYSGHVSWGKIRERYGRSPRARVHMRIEFTDGSTQTLGTDGTWKATYGPILESDFLMGERYDARLEMLGWDAPGFDDSEWASVERRDPVDIHVEAYPGVTVQKTEEISATGITEPAPGVYVFDLGQNMVGWARLKVKGKAGQTVTLRFVEVLNPDGTPYTTNLRDARCIDSYTLRGEGEEVWEPKFTFHGFRYVEVTGYPGHPPLDAVTGVVLHSAAPLTGVFECSNPMVNQLVRNIVWGQRGNYLEVPTDCPQRDERLGWTGDAQVFIGTGAYNMDIGAFFTKWLVDLEDSRNDAGAYAHVAPDVGVGFDSPGWADAAIICPYVLYQMYGDTRMIERHYEAMAGYIRYLKENSDDLIRPAIGFGDWLSLNADTPKEVIATAYFAHVARLMAEMARIVGRSEDADEFTTLAGEVKSAFNKAFVSKDGRIHGHTQTGYVLGLDMDLLEKEHRPIALSHLVRDLYVRNWHQSTGFLGIRPLLPTLTKMGRNDIAYRLLLNDTFPSWGFEIKNGATTIWERWDGWTDEFGFQDPGMNSFNHYAYGAVGEWLYNTVAGIQPGKPGFESIVIRPRPGGGLTHVNARYNSIRGWIGCEWNLRDGDLHLNVHIPAGTTATVYVPTGPSGRVLEGQRPAKQAEGVAFLRKGGDATVYQVGSGTYCFTSSKYASDALRT